MQKVLSLNAIEVMKVESYISGNSIYSGLLPIQNLDDSSIPTLRS